jgi:DNA repair photolyase
VPDDAVRVHERQVRALLRRERFSEPFLAAKYRFSPYSACEHGCLYRDGRAERYYVEGEFDRDIIVRANAPELLAAELPRLRERGVISIGSGITDAYQPAEGRLGLTRRCAEALAGGDHAAALLTKSALAVRDLDLWTAVNAHAGFVLLVSLVFADDAPRCIFEPRAASVAARLGLLRAFGQRGCAVGVLAMPLLPFICDSDQDVAALLDALAAVPVDFVIPAGLTLRPGRQKETYLATLRREHPALLPRVEALYAECRASGAPLAAYSRELAGRCAAALDARGLPGLVPHAAYRGRMQLYDELGVLLLHMEEIYNRRGVDTAALRAARRRYMEWLAPRKAEVDRRRSLRHDALDEELRALCASRELESVLDNQRLAAFTRAVVLERRVFDYVEAKLRP